MANSTSEKNQKFIDFLNAGEYDKETIKQAIKVANSFKAQTVEEIVDKIIARYNECKDAWDVQRVAEEYYHLTTLEGKDLELWKKYRGGYSCEPIRKADGHYIETKVVGLSVVVDNVELSIDPNSDSLSFGCNHADANGHHAIVNVSVLKKALKVKEELNNVLRYLE